MDTAGVQGSRFEHQVKIGDPVGLHVMEQEQISVQIQFFIGERSAFLTDIGPLERRNAGKRFRILFGFLIGFQILCPFHHVLQLFPGKAGTEGLQLLGKRLILSCGKTFFGLQDQYAAVCIVQEIRTDQVFKITGARQSSEFFKDRKLLHLREGILRVVQPGSENIQTVEQSLRIGRIIGFPIAELHGIKPCFDGKRIDSFFRDLFQCTADDGNKLFLLFRIGTLGDDGEIRLQDPAFIGSVDVFSDPCVKKGLLQRSPLRAQKRIVQDIHGHGDLCIGHFSHYQVPGQVGIVLFTFVLGHGIHLLRFLHCCERSLKRNRRLYRQSVKGRQITVVQEVQLFRHVHISVQEDEAVGRMIIGPVKIQEAFVCKIRDHVGVSAGLAAVGGIRKQGIHDLPFQNVIRGREGSLHLIVNHSADRQRAFRIFKVIVPAFLAENLFFFVNIRIEHGIQIHMHQILEVLVIAAGYRITGLVRVGHGVQEGIQRPLYQFDKRIFQGEIPRSAQDAVLRDMGHAGGILRRCPESDVEHLVFVVIFDQHDSGSCLSVTEQSALGMDVREVFLTEDLIRFRYVFSHCFSFCDLFDLFMRVIGHFASGSGSSSGN